MLRLTIAVLVGNLIVQQLSELPALGWLTAAIIATAFCVVARLTPVIAGLGIGFFGSLALAGYQMTDVLGPMLEGVDVAVVGLVSGIPNERGDVSRFELVVDDAATSVTLPRTIRLSWYHPTARLQAGQRWAFTVRLKRPHGFMNPGGFDFEGWLFRRGIGASGYVRATPAPLLLRQTEGYGLDRLRQYIASEVRSALSGSRSAGVAAALAVGDRSAIAPEQWAVFAATGTSHLMAISGLHVGLVAGWIFVLVRWVWPWCPGLSRLWPVSKAAAVAAFFAACGYSALAGFALPTQRALIMLSVVLGSTLLSRVIRPSQALSLALLLVLLIDPAATLSPGFWLSFVAVAFIFYLTSGRLRRPRGLGHWGALQVGLALALAPLLLWFFHGASLVAPVANAIAIPWVGMIGIPLILVGTALLLLVPALGQMVVGAFAALLSPLWPLLDWLAGLPFAQWWVGSHSPVAWLLSLAGVLLLLAPRGVPARSLGVLLLMPLMLGGSDRLPRGAFELTVLDVGQGLAVVVETARHVLVFDTGARWGDRFDVGRSVVAPFLRSRGIGSIDRIVVTHGDIDHSGGAESLLRAFSVGDVLSGPGVRRLHARQQDCRLGDEWAWDGVDFEVMNPPGEGAVESENDGSCVIRVSAPGGAVLLAADIEASAESRLLSGQGERLSADVLIVPHHGSNSSSTEAFIAAVSPRLALVSAGYRNRYRFPATEVCRRYVVRGIRILETASEGGIGVQVTPSEGPIVVRRHRSDARRYWHVDKPANCSSL